MLIPLLLIWYLVPSQNSPLMNRTVIKKYYPYFKLSLILLVYITTFLNMLLMGLSLCRVWCQQTFKMKKGRENLEIILNHGHQYTVTGNLLCHSLEWVKAELGIWAKTFTIPYDNHIQYISLFMLIRYLELIFQFIGIRLMIYSNIYNLFFRVIYFLCSTSCLRTVLKMIYNTSIIFTSIQR